MRTGPEPSTGSESRWPKVKLGEIVTPVAERVGRSRASSIPVLSMTRDKGLVLQSHRFDNRVASADVSAYKLVRRGELVYGFPMDEGVIAVLHRYDCGAVSPIYNVWRIDASRAEPAFLDLLLKTPALIAEYRKRMSTTVERRRIVSPRDFETIMIHLPPLAEQRAITGAIRAVQQAREATEQALIAARELKKSIARQLFRYGAVSVEQATSVVVKNTEIGAIPASWDVKPLSSVCRIVSGGTPRRDRPDYWNGGIPWLKTGEINYSVIRSTDETISSAGLANSSARIVPAGTVVMAMYGQGVTRGRVSVLGIDSALNQACAAFVELRGVTAAFLYCCLEQGYSRVRTLAHGAHQPNLSAELLYKLQIPVAPLEDQQRIASMIERSAAKTRAEERRSEALSLLLKSVTLNLVIGRVRVPVEEDAQ